MFGRVLDADGRPVADARVSAVSGTSQAGTVRADGAGRYTLTGLPPGRLQLIALAPGPDLLGRFSPQSIEVPSGGRIQVDISERKVGATVRIRLTGHSSGRTVVMLVAGAAAEVLRSPAERRLPSSGAASAPVFTQVPAGEHTLMILRLAEDGEWGWMTQRVLVPSAQEVLTVEVSLPKQLSAIPASVQLPTP